MYGAPEEDMKEYLMRLSASVADKKDAFQLADRLWRGEVKSTPARKTLVAALPSKQGKTTFVASVDICARQSLDISIRPKAVCTCPGWKVLTNTLQICYHAGAMLILAFRIVHGPREGIENPTFDAWKREGMISFNESRPSTRASAKMEATLERLSE